MHGASRTHLRNIRQTYHIYIHILSLQYPIRTVPKKYIYKGKQGSKYMKSLKGI